MAMVACPFQTPCFVRDDERGTFIEVVNTGPWETVIVGRMKAGAVMGNHYHKKTRIFLFLTEGSATVDVVRVATGSRRRCDLPASRGLFLDPGEAHAIRFREDSRFVLLKSRRYEETDSDTFPYVVANAGSVCGVH